MSYAFTIKNGFRVKSDGKYPWGDPPDKLVELHQDDVLTHAEDGTYVRHTGICCVNIWLKPDEVEPIGKPVALQMI